MKATGITRPGTLLVAVMALTVYATSAAAQSTYVAGVGFANIKQFDSIQDDPRALISAGNSTSLDGTAPGGGIRAGTFLHSLWSLEIGVESEARTTRTFENPYAEILRLYPTSLRIPEISGSTSFLTVNTVVGFHPAKSGRVRLGYLGGFSFVRGTYRSTLPAFDILATADAYFLDGSGVFTGISSRIPTFPDFRATTLRRTDNAAGAVLGFEAAIDMSRRWSVVPGIRTIVFSNGGQSVFLIRPEAGVRWSF